MPRVSFVSLIVAVILLPIGPATLAHTPNAVGRYLGIGWSDGYHSHTACPPKQHAIHQRPVGVPVMATGPVAPAPAPVPWWKTPVTPEPIPAPEPQAAPSSSSAGQSLFRQPGDGPSVTALNAPQQ
jgi:cell division septation protein DedD